MTQAEKPNCSPDWLHQGRKECWTPPWKVSCFLETSQISPKIIFPSQYSDVTAFIKKGRASPQNAKLKNFLRVKLYLKSETNFFSLLVFTGSQGSKNWRRARHHDATFVMKTKRYIKRIPTFFCFACLVPPKMETATFDFSF